MANPKRYKILDALRVANGLTNAQLAKKCDVTKSTVHRWLSGPMDDATAIRLLDAMEADIGTRQRCGVAS